MTQQTITSALESNTAITLVASNIAALPSGVTDYTASLAGNGAITLTAAGTAGSTLELDGQIFYLPLAGEVETVTVANGAFVTDLSLPIASGDSVEFSGTAIATIAGGSLTIGGLAGAGTLTLFATAASTLNYGTGTLFVPAGLATSYAVAGTIVTAEPYDISNILTANQALTLQSNSIAYLPSGTTTFTRSITSTGADNITLVASGGAASTLVLDGQILALPDPGERDVIILSSGVFTADLTDEVAAGDDVFVPSVGGGAHVTLSAGSNQINSLMGQNFLTISGPKTGIGTLVVGSESFAVAAGQSAGVAVLSGLIQGNVGFFTENTYPMFVDLPVGTTTDTGTISGNGVITLTGAETGASTLNLYGHLFGLPTSGETELVSLSNGVFVTDLSRAVAAGDAIDVFGNAVATLGGGGTLNIGSIYGNGTIVFYDTAAATIDYAGGSLAVPANTPTTYAVNGGTVTAAPFYITSELASNGTIYLQPNNNVALLPAGLTDYSGVHNGASALVTLVAAGSGASTLRLDGALFILPDAGETQFLTLGNGRFADNLSLEIAGGHNVDVETEGFATLGGGTSTIGNLTGNGTLTLINTGSVQSTLDYHGGSIGVAAGAEVYLGINGSIINVLPAPTASSSVTIVSGNGSHANPYTLAGSGDITALVLANDYINLGGGHDTITIPIAGSSNTVFANETFAATENAGNQFDNIEAGTPVLEYTGALSGTGSIEIGNASDTIQPGIYQEFSGGVLQFDSPQSFTNPNGASYIIDPNTVLRVYSSVVTSGTMAATYNGSLAPGATLINNGLFQSNQASYPLTSISGIGYIDLGDQDLLTSSPVVAGPITGMLLDSANANIRFSTPASLNLWQRDIGLITGHGGGSDNLIGSGYTAANNLVIGGNYYTDGVDTQLQGTGVTQFDGQCFLIPTNLSIAGYSGLYPASEAQKYDYTYNISDLQGRAFYLVSPNQSDTMLLGDGRAVVNNSIPAGAPAYYLATNNTFAQGNPQNFRISTGFFQFTAATTFTQAMTYEALAFDYSGTYSLNIGINQLTGNSSVSSYNSIAGTLRMSDLGPYGTAYSNLIVVNPGAGIDANHLIVTQPIYALGITDIQANTVLQLGDGTTGTPYGATITATTNGVTGTYDYNASGGDGALVTRGNYLTNYVSSQAFIEITNSGGLIIDNMPGAYDEIFASAGAYSLVSMNELDNIAGIGSLVQEGALALTLEGNTTYSGGTTIAAGRTINLISNTLTGATGLPNSVLTLQGTNSMFDISQADRTDALGGLAGVAGSTIALGGNTLVVNAASASLFSGTIQDGGAGGGAGGALVKIGAGLLELGGAAGYTGTTSIMSGALKFDSGDIASSGIYFGPATTLIMQGTTHFAGMLQNLGMGDTIVLDGITSAADSFGRGVLTLSGGGVTDVLNIAGSFTTANFEVTDIPAGTEVIVVCYLRGTRIATPAGEIGIEHLRIGDAVITRFGGYRKIKWIGRQSFGRRFIAGNRAQIPVCIRQGALGPMIPKRDLFISPGHSMLIDGVLVLASQLVNGVTITQGDVPEEVHYYQLEFETHDCVLAEGAWSESYADTPDLRRRFHNAAAFHDLYPDHIEPVSQQLCAPRPIAGELLERAVWQAVARAAACVRPGPVRGYVEMAGTGGIVGWAWDESQPELPVMLEIFCRGLVIGQMLACHHRGDLEAAGLGHGFCGFTFVPQAGARLAADDIEVRRLGDGAPLARIDDAGLRRCG